MQTFWNTKKGVFFCALYIYESTTVSPDEELKMNWALGKAAHRSKRRREGTAPTHLLLLPADRLSKHGQAFPSSSLLRCSKRTCPFAGIFHILDYDDRGKSWKCKRWISNILQKNGSKDILLKVCTWSLVSRLQNGYFHESTESTTLRDVLCWYFCCNISEVIVSRILLFSRKKFPFP